MPLDMKSKIEEKIISKVIDSSLNPIIVYHVDPKILGGIIIQTEDQLIDLSANKQMEILRKELSLTK